MGSEWGAAAIGGLIVAVIGAIGLLIQRWYKAKGLYLKDDAEATVTISIEQQRLRSIEDQREKKQESDILKEYKQLVKEQKAEREEDRQLIHDLRDELNAVKLGLAICKAGRAKADERIAALEEALKKEGIEYRKWEPDSDTGLGTDSRPHTPLKEKGER